MTVRELYEWAKEKNLLDVQIAKHFNFNIKDIEQKSRCAILFLYEVGRG